MRLRGKRSRLWCSIAVLPCFSASGKIPVTRCGLLLRGTYATYGALSFGSRLSALRNTHNPSELHGKRMAERLPLQCSGTLSGGTLCHLPAVVPHRFWHGQLGIEPTARGFGDRVATLEHLPAYLHSKPDVTPVSPFVSICALTFRRRTSRPLPWLLPSKSHLLCAITPNRFNFDSVVCPNVSAGAHRGEVRGILFWFQVPAWGVICRMEGATSRPRLWGSSCRPTGSRHIPLARKRLCGFLYLYSATNSTRGALEALAGLEPAYCDNHIGYPALPLSYNAVCARRRATTGHRKENEK